jgi:cytochrome c-type biogenesis protein CcmH/NrfG
VVVGVVLVPTAIVAALKLRRRDLSAILEGAGWAINARMRLNRRQRRQFTRLPSYPEGAVGTPGRRWLLTVLIVLLLAALGVLAWQLLGTGRRPMEQPAPEPPAESSAPVPPTGD